jgi:hypothetical protein
VQADALRREPGEDEAAVGLDRAGAGQPLAGGASQHPRAFVAGGQRPAERGPSVR